MRSVTPRLVNPLPLALAHYERALEETLEAGGLRVAAVARPSIEQPQGHRGRELRDLVAALGESRRASEPTIVLWPSLGYLEALIEGVLCPKAHVIFHDTQPMRRQFGLRRWQGRAVAPLTRTDRLHVIVHSQAAGQVLVDLGWRRPTLLPHPLRSGIESGARVDTSRSAKRCLILGQYKPSRSIRAIADLPRHMPEWKFRVVGRDWPPIAGFEVHSAFVGEADFESELRAADVVLIPYERFFQSGVLVRALEVGRPVVSVDHEQTRSLYGDDWPGIVERWDSATVVEAIKRVAALPVSRMIDRYAVAREDAALAWVGYLQGA